MFQSLGLNSPMCLVYIFILFIYYFIWGFTSLSQWVVGRGEETSVYSSSGFCTVNCRPMASNYQLSYLRPCLEPNPSESVITLPPWNLHIYERLWTSCIPPVLSVYSRIFNFICSLTGFHGDITTLDFNTGNTMFH